MDKALVVDDEADLAAVVASYLRQAGFAARTVGDGTAAVNTARVRALFREHLAMTGEQDPEVLAHASRAFATAATSAIGAALAVAAAACLVFGLLLGRLPQTSSHSSTTVRAEMISPKAASPSTARRRKNRDRTRARGA